MRCRFPKCRIFRLMIWRSFKKQKQHKFTFILAAVIPLLFSIVILALRSVANINIDENSSGTTRSIQYALWWQNLISKINTRRDQMIKERPNFQSNVFVPTITLGYAPNSTEGIRKLIEGVIRSLSMNPAQISSFADCEELRIRAYSDQFLASICFHNVDESQRGLPLKLHFSILMPSELRHYEDSWIGNSWIMNNKYRTHADDQIDSNTSISNYVREGFISLQYYISFEYLQIASGNAKIPEVILRSYTINDNVYELLSLGVNTPVIVLLLGFMFPVTIFTKDIVEERAVGIHFALNTNQHMTRMQFAVWYLNGVCLLMVTCTIFTLMLKINWGGHSSFFSKCPWSIMLFFLASYVLSAAAFAILMGVIMGSTKMVVAVVPVYWILASLPLLSGQSVDSTWGYALLFAASLLLCNVTMCRGLRRILCLEHVDQMNVKQYFMSTLITGDSTLLMFIGLFYIQTCLYVLLALVLDGNICPCVLRLIKCTPCRLLLVKLRKWYKKRRRRRQELRETEAEFEVSFSRRVSELTDRSERLTKTVDYKDEPIENNTETEQPKASLSKSTEENRNIDNIDRNIDNIDRNIDSIDRNIDNIDRNIDNIDRNIDNIDRNIDNIDRNIDASDESNPSEHESVKTMPDHELYVWRSDQQLGESSGSQSTRFYLEQSSNVEKPSVDESEGENISNIDETTPIVIEFQNVWKKYHKTFAVRNFSLKVYQNETVVLLGHNASGKTTILNMLCGATLPTLGSISISGYNVVNQSSRAYENVGLSLHNLNLFSEFTFSEHIVYLCRLRGLSLIQSQNDVTSYMQSLNVQHLKNTFVRRLTTGQKRLLQMLCAFAGRTKIVILDKPMEGVDASKRGLFYNFAQREKNNRTIFLTTNLPHVASNLADRIGLLINGNLYACGPEKDLVKLDKNVYRLICYLEPQCDFSALYKFFAYHLPNIEVELRRRDSAVFIVEHFDLPRLMKLIDLLANSKKKLHVDSFKLMTPNVENILLKAMMHKLKSPLVNSTLYNLATRIRHVEEIKLNAKRSLFQNLQLFYTHMAVVIRKRCLMDIRSYIMPLMQIFLPGILCALIFALPHLKQDRQVLHAETFRMNNYFQKSITMLQDNATLDPVLTASRYYRDNATADQTIIVIDKNNEILNSMRLYMTNNYLITDLNLVLSAIFSDESVEALYNNNLIHSAPVSLTLVLNALAVGFVDPSSGISVKLELLPFSTLHTAHLGDGVECLNWIFQVMTGFCFCFVWALPMLNFGLGRDTPYGRVELIAGMRFSTLSIANFVYGISKVLLSLIPLNAFMMMFTNALPLDLYNNYKYIYFVLIAGFYVISLDILVSYFISEIRLTYVYVIMFYSMFILLYMALFETPNSRLLDFHTILRIHPFYNLIDNLMIVNNLSEISKVCSDEQSFETSVYLEQCQKIPNCCDKRPRDYISWDLVWSNFLIILFIWIFLYAINFKDGSKMKPQQNKGKDDRDSNPDSCYDQSVLHFGSRNVQNKTWIKEKIRVRTLERPLIRNKALNVESLSVFMDTNVVLHRINFLLERHQVLSIIGINGSGKTVLIKSLLGTLKHSTGTIHSYCNPFYRRLEDANCMHLAYCPQDDDVTDAITVTEFLQFVLTIRGLKQSNMLHETNHLLRMFDLYNSRFHLLPNCSRGILKRLNIAVALIGYAGLILMDDPFSYLDASSWRKMYSIIESQCENGQAVIYTSSDPRYSDLSHRTAILQSTSLCVIGERQELQLEQFAAYIVVDTHIRIKGLRQNDWETSENVTSEKSWNYMQTCSIVEHIFPHAIIKSRTGHMVSFWLSSKTYSMSHILETLHKNPNTFFAYSIQTPSIKQLFGSMVIGPIRFIDVTETEDTECLYFNN